MKDTDKGAIAMGIIIILMAVLLCMKGCDEENEQLNEEPPQEVMNE